MEAHNATIFGYDKYNAQQLAEELKQEGFEPIQFAQNGAHFNEPMREFMILLGRGQIVHDGNEVLRWAANNMSITRNAQDQWMPDKRSSKDKIDPIVAVLMAFRLAALQPAVTTGSKFVY
jgi:phage terminase large subunit-like protein